MHLQVSESSASYTNLITEADYQEYIRYDGSDQSTIIDGLVESAIRQAEAYCNATFGDKTYVVYFNDVEAGKEYTIPFGEVRAVSAVAELTEVDGDEPSESAITTGFKLIGGRRYIKFGASGSYKVTYTAGNTTPSDVNEQVKQAILLILSENFENREEIVLGQSVAKLPRNSKVLLAPFRRKVI